MTVNLITPSILFFAAVFATVSDNDFSGAGTHENQSKPQPIELIRQIQDTSPVVAAGAELQKISDQFKFTEGPAPDKNGNVYFTDQPNNNIWKYDTKGNLTLFFAGAGRSNGLYID